METGKKKKIGLALSGGGYRAAAYHIGTLKALNRLDILGNIDVISSVSGGSITAVYYALHKEYFEEFEKTIIAKLQVGVLLFPFINLIAVIFLIILSIGFFGWWVLTVELILLFFFNYKILSFSFWIEKAYDKLFFKHVQLSNLPIKPLLAINSTDVATGTLFTFSQIKMAGYRYEGKEKNIIFKHEDFPVARSVMASSCVPFAFSPIRISKKYYNVPFKKGELKPLLIDGGLYDNQGSHKLSEKNSIYHTQNIIVSDAGVGDMNARWAFNIPLMLVKTSNIMMRRIKTFQIRNNIYSGNKEGLKYAYLSLDWDVSERPIWGFIQNILEQNIAPELLEFHGITKEDIEKLYSKENIISSDAKQKILERLKQNIGWSNLISIMPALNEHKIAKTVGTNLTALKEKQINALIKHSNWLAEVQIKLYLPFLLTE
jgi:NTE family protein